MRILIYLLLSYSLYSQAYTLVEQLSAQQLNTPYLSHPLGEGHLGRVDPQVNFRVDGFDCQTYVNTVLAFALDPTHPQLALQKIRYHKKPHTFLTRNHFVSLDLNPHWHQLHLTQDNTCHLLPTHHQLCHISLTEINKERWLQKQLSERGYSKPPLHFSPPSLISRLSYIPIKTLLMPATQRYWLAHLNSGSILEIVRPGWDLTKTLGTHLQVSHLGFVIHTQQGWVFRHAHAQDRVVDTPLIPYLAKHPTWGVHIEKITL